MKIFKRATLTGQPSDMVEETCAIHLRFSAKNGLKSLVCFIALVVIALFVRDSFIRPTFGDVLVVVWLYYFLASLFSMPVNWLVSLVVLIAFATLPFCCLCHLLLVKLTDHIPDVYDNTDRENVTQTNGMN